MFPRAPNDPGRSDFPNPARGRSLHGAPSRGSLRFKSWPIYALARPKFTRRLASAESDRCGWLKVQCLLPRRCTACPEVLCSRSVTHPSSLLRPHVPVPKPLTNFVSSTRWSVLAAWTTHCWSSGPSRRYVSSNPSLLDAWTYTPAASGVHSPVSSSKASAFPNAVAGRRSATFHATTSARVPISGLQISLCSGLQVCLPPRSFLPP